MSGGVWPTDDIPDDDIVFRRVHRQWRSRKTPSGISAAAFVGTRNGGLYELSTDWSKYSNAQEARDRAQDPAVNGVAAFVVGNVRQIPGQKVVHNPIQGVPGEVDNQAHSLVVANNHEDPEIQRLFQRIVTLPIPLP